MNRYAFNDNLTLKPRFKARKRWNDLEKTEQEKLIKELQSSNSVAMLMLAAQTLGIKPTTQAEARDKQARAYSVMILNHVMSSPNDELGSFVHGLVLPAVCSQEIVMDQQPGIRPRRR